jgi:hypothetical protein
MSQSGQPRPVFLIARNPQPDTKLPYLLKLPLEGGLVLKARDTWPRVSRIYCHRFEEDWPTQPEILERVPVTSCRRRGAAIDLVLDRPRLARSQFVFTEVRGRPAIFWQTQKTARSRPSERRLRQATTRSGPNRARSWQRWSERAWTTWPPPSRTGPSPSKCNG